MLESRCGLVSGLGLGTSESWASVLIPQLSSLVTAGHASGSPLRSFLRHQMNFRVFFFSLLTIHDLFSCVGKIYKAAFFIVLLFSAWVNEAPPSSRCNSPN